MKTKKLLKFLACFFAAISFLTGCTKEPVATISADRTSIKAGETVKFSNSTKDGDSYKWEFGDGSTSSEKSPSHTFANAGTFSVKMTAYSKNEKKSDFANISITVTQPDPCQGITCLNGGTCANGLCNCPPGYTGSDCGTEKTPVSVTITKIVLTNFPSTNSGSNWDFSAGPDIFLSINSGTSANQNDFLSGVSADAVTGNSITYTNYFPATIPSPSGYWTIGLWDDDSPDTDDFMGGIYFIPNSYKSGFPSTITLSNSSISMTLYVTWNF